MEIIGDFYIQGSAKSWPFGCVNSRPATGGSQEAGFTQPREHLIVDPSSLMPNCVIKALGDSRTMHACIMLSDRIGLEPEMRSTHDHEYPESSSVLFSRLSCFLHFRNLSSKEG